MLLFFDKKRRLEEEIPVRNWIISYCRSFSYDLASTDADSGYPHRISPNGVNLVQYVYQNRKYVETVPEHITAADNMNWFINNWPKMGFWNMSHASGHDPYKGYVRILFWGSIDRVNWINRRIEELNNQINNYNNMINNLR